MADHRRAGLRFAAEGRLDDNTVAAARTLAGLAGQALERAQLFEAEYTAAHELQRSLLPRLPAQLAAVSIGTQYRPAEQGHEVGGDWYDAFELPGGRLGLVIGDVAGHDLRAAIAMGRLQPLLRQAAVGGAAPADVLAALDAGCPAVTGTELATMVYLEYDPAASTLTYTCAGHPPPLIIQGTKVSYLTGGRSPAIGLGGPFVQHTVAVSAGTRLVLYTDGLIERRDQDLDVGLDRLAATAATLPAGDPQAWCQHLLTAMTDNGTLADDVAVACIDLKS